MNIARRQVLELLARSAGALACATTVDVLRAGTPRRETPDLIQGPFYPQRKPSDTDSDLTLVRGHDGRATGQVVRLHGRVLDKKGEPVRNARIEVWQANSFGRYAHASDPNTQLSLDPNFQGYASLTTDREGAYHFTTIKPGPYPTLRGDMRAPHIHFEIQGRVDRKVTQLFFPNEPLNDRDRHLHSTLRPEMLIAQITPSADSTLMAQWDIVLTTG